MVVLKLPLAIFGGRDCDIVNSCFPFLGGPREVPLGVIFGGTTATDRQDEPGRKPFGLLVWRGLPRRARLRPVGRAAAVRTEHPRASVHRLCLCGGSWPSGSPYPTAAAGAGTHSGTRVRPGMRRRGGAVSCRKLHRRSRGRSLTKRLRRRRPAGRRLTSSQG
jgi:hypothetical protein